MAETSVNVGSSEPMKQDLPPAKEVGAEGVRLLTLSNPPHTELTVALCAQLAEEISAALEDPKTDVIVLRGSDGHFATAAPGPSAEDLWDAVDALTHVIETARVPVLALLEGDVAPVGAAIALACHLRIGAADLALSLADPSSGQVPRGGITQRLPRLAGADVALDLVLSGRHLGPEEGTRLRVLNGVAKGDLSLAGLKYARRIAADPDKVDAVLSRRAKLRDGIAFQKAVAAARAQVAESDEAAQATITCVEAALLLPAEQGLNLEQELARDVADAPTAQAMAHLARAEAGLRPLPYPRFKPKPVTSISCVGRSAEATALIVAALAAQISVRVVANTPADLRAAQDDIVKRLDAAVAQGGLSEADRNARMQRVTGAIQSSAIEGSDAVFVVPGQADLDEIVDFVGHDVPVATFGNRSAHDGNPSVFSYDAASATRAGSAVELGWSGNSHRQPLCTLQGLIQDLGQPAILWRHDKSRPPLARLREATWAMGLAMAEAGAHPARIDLALQRAGFHILPFSGQDRIGLDEVHARLAHIGIGSALLDAIRDKGWSGRRSGKGWFSYSDGSRTAEPNPELDALLPKGTYRNIAAEDIVNHMAFAMAHEGLRIHADNGVRSLGAIDAALCNGGGAPRSFGGPFFVAESAGLLTMQRALRRLLDKSDYWTPHPSLDEAIKNGGTFAGVAS